MSQFIHFKHDYTLLYPVGSYYLDDSYKYIKEIAKIIHKTFSKKDRIILIARGHSGSILAGGIAYSLEEKGRKVEISVSRKSENSHGSNFSGVHRNLKNSRIVVIDDFIESGETISIILKDLSDRLGYSCFDMLCLSNHLDDCTDDWKFSFVSMNYLKSSFKYICCNKPKRGLKVENFSILKLLKIKLWGKKNN